MRVGSVDATALASIREAALSSVPVSLGIRRTATPHEFYRYPARFSPQLAAAAISAFTDVGDLVADYFVGGGTTLVEARLASRLGFGSDINSLSVFVSRVKTRLYSHGDLRQVDEWSQLVSSDTWGSIEWPADDQAMPYFRNFSDPALSEQRRLILSALRGLTDIEPGRARDLARCVLLRTAQWALDMRSEVPTADSLVAALRENAIASVAAARSATARYRSADQRWQSDGLHRSYVLHDAVPGVAARRVTSRYPTPALVLTSPPYPGVYVNYHRWKVRGRLETPLPYFIAGQTDGHGLAHYTMAARSDRSQDKYFHHLEAGFADIASLCGPNTWLVQVVGFNSVTEHLRRYLQTMARVGFDEVQFSQLATADDGRLWREVPGRRWWARAGDRSDVVPSTAREVILFHRVRS
jgi:DNA methylase